MKPQTAQQINDPQTGQVSTSRHSAFSELMIRNAELREQLRVLQSAYDSLSQMKEKEVAKRIEVDELRAENQELKAENARIRHDIEAYRGALGYEVPANHDGKLTDGTTPQCGLCNSDYRKNLEAENARLVAACGLASRYLRSSEAEKVKGNAPNYDKVLDALDCPKDGFSDLLTPTIELLNRLAHSLGNATQSEILTELGRLLGLMERNP